MGNAQAQNRRSFPPTAFLRLWKERSRPQQLSQRQLRESAGSGFLDLAGETLTFSGIMWTAVHPNCSTNMLSLFYYSHGRASTHFTFIMWIVHKAMLILTLSLFSLQMKVRAGGRTVAGVGSVWSGTWRAASSVCARNGATLRLFPCVALTDVFMRTTASCTAPLACSGGGSMWSTAKTAFSKVSCMILTAVLWMQPPNGGQFLCWIILNEITKLALWLQMTTCAQTCVSLLYLSY